MPAKKKAKKKMANKKIVAPDHSQLFLQAMVIALVGAAAIFAVIRTSQFRDNVDNEMMRVLGAQTEVVRPIPKK